MSEIRRSLNHGEKSTEDDKIFNYENEKSNEILERMIVRNEVISKNKNSKV